VNERKAMINRESKPSIAKQCKLLDISRSGFYYQPAPVSAVELEQMRLIDEGHMKHPYFGSRRLRDWPITGTTSHEKRWFA